jgi:hypothetical protein
MQNLPLFTTEYGVASLILREIPYTKTAYIRIQDTQDARVFTDECAQFCRAAGAENIYATGNGYLEAFPFYTEIWEMRAQRSGMPQTQAVLQPVTEETITAWLQLYNDKMAKVENAAFKNSQDGRELLRSKNAYFVYMGEQLVGIGIAGGNEIAAMASLQQGAGADVLLALSGCLSSEEIMLTVASTNQKALSLYTKLGFVKIKALSRWYTLS